MPASLLLTGMGFEAGSKHCGECKKQLSDWDNESIGGCDLFSDSCGAFAEIKRDADGNALRCQPCLDAERAAGEMEAQKRMRDLKARIEAHVNAWDAESAKARKP